jgi:hypothetical protein
MAAELTRLTHKIAIQLYLVAESCTICSYRSMRPVHRTLFVIKNHAMKTYKGVELPIHALLTWALGGEWSTSRLSRFTPRERQTVATGWVGPRAHLDVEA